MGKKVCSRKKVFVKEHLSKRNKISFLFISLPWLSNELLWSINKLKQGLWCTIWLSYIYIYIYLWYYFIYLFIYLFFGFYTEFLLRCVSIYILVFANLFICLLIYLGVPWGCSFLVQLHVDDMQLYQQWNTLRLYRAAFCGGVYFQ